MNILFTNFHANDGGGHVTYILNLARELSREHGISIATPATSRLFRYASELPGIRVVDQRFTSRIGPMVGEVRQLRQLLRAGRFDIIHANGSADHRHVMLACAGLRRRPCIVWTKHNDHSATSLGNRMRARWATDQAIAVSGFVAGLLAHSPYARCPVSVIRHGIDTDYFTPVDATEKRALRRALLGTDADGLIVLGSSGGTDYDKGWLDLLAGIALLPPGQRARFRVMVAGRLPDGAKRARVEALGMQDLTVFPGLVQDVRPLLAACDIGFVLSYREALSYACRETMALGLPTLVSAVGGLPENITDGTDGWIVPPRSPEAIRDHLAAILASPDAITTMGRAARKKGASEFALAPFIQATFGVYQRAVAGSPATAC